MGILVQFSGTARREWQSWKNDYVTYWTARSGLHRLRIELRKDGYAVRVNGSGWVGLVEKRGDSYVSIFGTFEHAVRIAETMLDYAERKKRIVNGYVCYDFIDPPNRWWEMEETIKRLKDTIASKKRMQKV